MKRYLTYIFFAALALLALGCKKEDDADRKELDSRQRVPVSVTYSVDGTQVTALSFAHGAMQKTIDVSVNNENLHWDVLSNRPWCKVVQAEHQGSSSITLEIEANESFEAREPATLTFVAGEYRGASLTVSQSGSSFVISHPYLIFPKEESPIEVDITTLADQEWRVENDEWINVEEISALTDEGKKTTTLKIWPVDNDQDSRYATITLSTDEDKDIIALYQFGSELMYDGEGNIFFPGDEPASISFIAPEYVVKEVVAPDFATAVGKQNSDGTITFSIDFDDNLSDCELIREIPVSIVLNNASSTTIALPSMRQDFLPAGGLMTAVGIKAFAAKIAEGGDISSWQTDGVVRVLQNIDMDGVTDWAGIGTEEHPFSGVFDGEGHSIVNLRGSAAPLFNFCDGSTVRNLTVAKNCDFFVSSGAVLAGFAADAKAATFDHCVFLGGIEFAGKVDNSSVGAIVAVADDASIINVCKMNGTIKITSSTSPSDGYTICVGGIAGNSAGSVINCETSGTITLTSGHATANIGGITALLKEGASVSGNTFTGTMNLGGTGTRINAGALYGYAPEGSWSFDFDSDKSSPVGAINLNKYGANTSTRIFLGGFVGLVGEGVSLSLKGFDVQTNFFIDYTALASANYICAGGAFGSCEPDALAGDLVMDGITNYGTMTFKYKYLKNNPLPVTRNCMGGIAGLVNGDATFSHCVNKATLGIKPEGGDDYPATSNNYTMIMGGIAGHCYGANMRFTDCENQADLTNNFYSNRPAEHANGNYYDSIVTGGVVGAFNFKPNPQNKTLTVSGCTSNCRLVAFRGFLGGVIGYAYQASVSNCLWTGDSVALTIDSSTGMKNDNLAAYKGGIAGGLGNATVTDCSVKSDIDAFRYGTAEAAEPGGIVGHVMYKSESSSPFNSPVKISGCSYHGNIFWEASKNTQLPNDGITGYPGGIVGNAGANTEIRNCRFGGKIMETEINANNVASLAVGNYDLCGCTVENISLWNGI